MLLSLRQLKNLAKQGFGPIIWISMFPYAYKKKQKNKFLLEEEGTGIMLVVRFEISLQIKIAQDGLA